MAAQLGETAGEVMEAPLHSVHVCHQGVNFTHRKRALYHAAPPWPPPGPRPLRSWSAYTFKQPLCSPCRGPHCTWLCSMMGLKCQITRDLTLKKIMVLFQKRHVYNNVWAGEASHFGVPQNPKGPHQQKGKANREGLPHSHQPKLLSAVMVQVTIPAWPSLPNLTERALLFCGLQGCFVNPKVRRVMVVP